MLFRIVAEGRPTERGPDYDPKSTLVEERVILFQATSPEDAIQQAEEEAREYCGLELVNGYGQTIRTRFLEALDAYELPCGTQPSRRCEVYSSTRVVPRSVTDETVVNRLMGPTERGRNKRRKFADGEIMTAAFSSAASADTDEANSARGTTGPCDE